MQAIQIGLFPDIPDTINGRSQIGSFLMLGGGVQSGTMIEMIAEGVLEKPTAAVFADTGSEPWWVYHFVGRYRRRLNEVGVPLIESHLTDTMGYRAKLHEWWAHYPSDSRSPSPPLYLRKPDGTAAGVLKRQCTDRAKIGPSNTAIKAWIYENLGYGKKSDDLYRPKYRLPYKRVQIEMWFGMTTDEMYRVDEDRGYNYQAARYPLIEMGMSRDDCLAWLAEHDLPIPFKSSCFMCPYKNNKAWLEMYHFDPETFEEACKFDDALRSTPKSGVKYTMYVHPMRIPLRQVISLLLEHEEKIMAGKTIRGIVGNIDGFKVELVDATGTCSGSLSPFSCST